MDYYLRRAPGECAPETAVFAASIYLSHDLKLFYTRLHTQTASCRSANPELTCCGLSAACLNARKSSQGAVRLPGHPWPYNGFSVASLGFCARYTYVHFHI